MSIKNIVTGQLAKITTYSGIGQVEGISTTGDITTTANLAVAGISELGPIGNIVITGGSAGEVITTDGTGNLSWSPIPIYSVPAVYIKSPFAGNNQSFSNTILASYNSNTEMTVFYNGVLLENTYYTLTGDVITVNIPLQIDDTIDIVTTISANVNSIVSSGYGNSNVAAYLPLYTGSLANLAGDVTTAANVTAAKVSLGTGNLQLTGNTISSAASIITIDPLGDGTPAGNVAIAGNLQVSGNITYNDIVNATTTDLQWIAANDAASASLATGGGLSVGPAGAYASFTYNSGSNVWQSSLPLLANGGVNANGALSGATTGSFSGNVTASYFIGNGSALTGMYGNAQVASYLPTYTGNLTAGNIAVTGNITASNDVTANSFIGDGSQLTGLPAPYTDADVSFYLATGINSSNIITTANISGAYILGNGSQLTGLPSGYTNSNVATYLASNANVVITTTGNITTTANISGGRITATGNVTGGNLISNQDIFGTGILTLAQSFVDPSAVTLRIFADGDTSFIQTGNGDPGSTGNVAFAPYFDGTGRVVINTGSGNVTAGNVIVSGRVAATGNVTGGNITTAGLVSATGNITGGNIKANTAVFIGTRSIQNPPTFSATGTGNTVITVAFSQTQVAYTTELIDTDGWFASNRYTPQLAGYYQISCGARVYVVGSGIDKEASIGLRKNNTVIAVQGGYGAVTSAVSQLVYFNGSTDYVDVSISTAVTGNVVQQLGQTYFTGYWVRP